MIDSHLGVFTSPGNAGWHKGRQQLTGFSAGSEKNILMTTSNSPQPVSLISYGGFITTEDGEMVTTSQWRSEVTSNGAGVALVKFELNFFHVHRHVLQPVEWWYM